MSMTYRNILVAVDDSKEAMLAFKRAVQVAMNNVHSKLYILHIIDTRTIAFSESYNVDFVGKIKQQAIDLLEKHEEIAHNLGFYHIETLVEYGSAKQIIARDIPQQKQIDLIICGISGKGEMERLFLSSVSTAIVRAAKCDVLVVRNG